MCVVEKVDVEQAGGRRSMAALQRAGGGAVTDKAHQHQQHHPHPHPHPHHQTTSRGTRLERRKLQRNRTAFTPSQIDQLEQGRCLPPPSPASTIRIRVGFTARCYASAVLAMGLCPCLSQVGVLSKRLNESSWFLACELPSTRPTLC